VKRHRWLVVLPLLVLGIVEPLQAGPKEEIAAATAQWASMFQSDNPDDVLALYASDAVLWGTLSPVVRRGRAAVRDYMVAAFKVLPGHRVSFGDQLIRVYGDVAINTGSYTFTYIEDGKTGSLPARYSFVYVNTKGTWLIVDHHSSAIPAAPLLGSRASARSPSSQESRS
jgi:uncharacterized protein (TIGR02246 family)